ncbi:MAG TPA: hypothetical protein PLZ51_08540, partial [Aggregatilineales bacterium]|nr:hypothetical protein [Aggregatilineales bacterium]
MTKIQSKINTNDPDFKANYDHNCQLLETLSERQAKVRQGGSDRARQRHIERGKLLPRERVELLL